MKLKHVLSAFLLLAVLIGACACSFLTVPFSDKVETEIYDYLKTKYPNLNFEIKSYTQDTYTSGRYEFHVLCTDTSIEFTIYHSSFLTTDSYSVIYTNNRMEESLFEAFGEDFNSLYVESIRWKDIYVEGCENYRFRDMDITKVPYAVSEVSDIRLFVLKDDSCKDATEAANAINAVVSKFGDAGIDLKKIVFQMTLGKDTVLLTTDAHSVRASAETALAERLTHIANAQETDDFVQVFYGQDLKTAEYFLKNEDEKSDKDKNENDENDKNKEKDEKNKDLTENSVGKRELEGQKD